MKPKRIVRPKEAWKKLGCGHTTFEEHYRFHNADDPNVPNTDIPRIKAIPLGQRDVGFLEALRRAPAPSSDIEARVRDYVRGLAPKVRGEGVGERLSIVWPGAQASSGYISEHTCDPLALVTALFPDRNACPRHGRGRVHGQRSSAGGSARAARRRA